MRRRPQPFRGVAAVVTLAALFLSSSASAATSVTSFNRFAYSNLTSVSNAAKYQFVLLGYGSGTRSQAGVRALIASIHANDPQTRILLYKNWSVAPGDTLGVNGCAPWNSSQPFGGVPMSWFLLTPSGTPVWNSHYAYYMLDPSNPQVQQACASDAATMAKLGGYDGVFWDTQYTSLFWASLSPRNCSSAMCQSDANWHSGMTSWVTNVSATLHASGLLSFGNIAGGNSSAFLGGGPGWWDAFLQAGFDGAEEESFTSGTNHVPIPLANWKLEVANEAWNEANGKYLLANADVGSNQALNVYGLATLLLAAGGRSSWDTDSGNYLTNEYWFPQYDTALALGGPLGPYSVQANGLYIRTFQNGSVAVNPTTTTISDPVYGNVAGQTGLIVGPGSPAPGGGGHPSSGGSTTGGGPGASAARTAGPGRHRSRTRMAHRRGRHKHHRHRHRSAHPARVPA